MKAAIFDIGSNSIRLIVFGDAGEPLFKGKINCRLGENVAKTGVLSDASIGRAFAALSGLTGKAYEKGVTEDGLFAFATEAVRRAADGKEFLAAVESTFKIKCRLLGGDEEAEIGLSGVLGQGDGAVIDIGGASSELAVRRGGKIIFSRSLDVGAGVLRDAYLNAPELLKEAAERAVARYGNVPTITDLYAIGGTASGCAYVYKNLDSYDERAIDGLILDKDFVFTLADKLLAFDDEERAKRFHLDENRAKVLPYGAEIFSAAIKKISPERVVVSERGNVEGYYEKLKAEGALGGF